MMQSCSMDDGDDNATDNGFDKRELLAACSNMLPGPDDPAWGLDSLSNDTLKVFPDEAAFHKLVMQCLVSSQCMVKIITSSIDASVFGPGSNDWMDYYQPYLGVYSSVNDSRSKQWELERDALYDGVYWDYHLKIIDLPEGFGTNNSGDKAVDLYYDGDFKNGFMVFSPTDFDAVRFPVKIFGPEIMGKLFFSNDGNTYTNELYLTNIGVNNNVKYIRNVYLSTEANSSCISVKAMIDFPALWFDTKENSGFTVSVIGACDMGTMGAVLYSGIVRNSSRETSVPSLVLAHPSDEVLHHYYPLWQMMIAESDSSNDDAPDEKDNEGESAAGHSDSGAKSGSVGSSLVMADGDNNIETEEDLYGKPGYYSNGAYVPSANVTDKTPYLKALNQCLDMMDDSFPISPYKNSVNQISWPSSEKTR